MGFAKGSTHPTASLPPRSVLLPENSANLAPKENDPVPAEITPQPEAAARLRPVAIRHAPLWRRLFWVAPVLSRPRSSGGSQ
jgi:hypothetical protein